MFYSPVTNENKAVLVSSQTVPLSCENSCHCSSWRIWWDEFEFCDLWPQQTQVNVLTGSYTIFTHPYIFFSLIHTSLAFSHKFCFMWDPKREFLSMEWCPGLCCRPVLVSLVSCSLSVGVFRSLPAFYLLQFRHDYIIDQVNKVKSINPSRKSGICFFP